MYYVELMKITYCLRHHNMFYAQSNIVNYNVLLQTDRIFYIKILPAKITDIIYNRVDVVSRYRDPHF